MKALGLRPVSLPGADVSLLLRGLALPVAIGRPIVSRAIAGARGGKSPSLRLHVRIQGAGVPTEAPWLNGAVADAGARTGTPTPVNAGLAALVDECAADEIAPPGSPGGSTDWWRHSPRGRRAHSDDPGPILRSRGTPRPPPGDPDRRWCVRDRRHPLGRDRRQDHRRPGPPKHGQRPHRGRQHDARACPRLALLSGLLDMLKGTVAVLLAQALGGGVGVAVLAGLAAIIGHSRSPFLGFGGGRGVAPAFGGLLAFQPLIALAIIPLFFAVIAITRYSSLGSLIGSAAAGILLVISTAVTPLDPWMYVYAVGGTALVWLFHLDNIQRLLAGKERKIGTPRPDE